MKTPAAILVQTKKPLEIDEIEIPRLREGQVLVKISHSGICGTQINEIDGKKGEDKWLPHCIGHEAIGSVVECGPSVSRVQTDDEVVLSWLKAGGIDAGGCQYGWQGKQVNAGPVTTFQHYAVVSENRVSKIPVNGLGELFVLLGCAAPTGMGAVRNVLRPESGQSVLVLGAGGVGLCAVMMAKYLDLKPVIVADLSDSRLELASQFGADITVNVSRQSLSEVISTQAGGCVDHAVEVTGSISVLNDVMSYLRPQGGRAVIIGNAPAGQIMEISPSQFNMGKSLLGTWGGDSHPDRDFEVYSEIMSQNTAPLYKLAEAKFALNDVNIALSEMRAKKTARPILKMV